MSAIFSADQDMRPVVVPFAFDHAHPDYVAVYRWRAQFLQRIRESKSAPRLIEFYRLNPIQFIVDWGMTFDPRNVEIGLPSKIPFVPYPKQIEWLHWVLARWKNRERGITEKSRGSGASWLAIALASTLCLFNRGVVIGFGSRKAEYVDTIGDPKSLFFKARMFLLNLPPEFLFGWNPDVHARQMRLAFPATESAMTGEAGDNIGRGDRTSLYFVDEAAFLEHGELAEASLSDTTNCRIDISTSNGSQNAFYDRRMALLASQVFTMHYSDDPRRDDAWLKKKLAETPSIIFEREYGINYDQGGSFFMEPSLLVDGKPVPMPALCDMVFATVDTAIKTGKEHAGSGVVFWAFTSRPEGDKHAVILDWDLTQIEAASLQEWVPLIFRRLQNLAHICHARLGSIGAFIEDKASGTVLLQQGAHPQNEWPVHAIDSKLTAMGKQERGIDVSPYVHQGMCKISEYAYNKVVPYKGVSKNHLLSQVLGFYMGMKDDAPMDLFDCFCYGLALSCGNRMGF